MTVAIYDGYCVICNTTRRIVKALDWFNRVEFVDLHNRPLIEQRFPQIDYESSMGEIHVVADSGRIYAGFNGTRRMLRDLPLGIPFWLFFHIPGVSQWLGPKVYRFIAKHRYAINRLFGVDLAQSPAGADCDNGVCKIPERGS